MSTERWRELVARANRLGRGPAQVALCEEAVREANDLKSGYWSRRCLIEAGTFGGSQEKSLKAFSWCLAQTDAHPDLFDEAEMIWPYKWILASATGFFEQSAEQIAAMQDDCELRLRRLGMSLRTIHHIRCQNAMDMGDRERLLRYLDLWPGLPRDRFSDCEACELNNHSRMLVFLGQDAAGLQKAAPILQGQMKCGEIPHLTFAEILQPLVRVGRLEEAAKCHRRGYRLIAKNCEFLDKVGMHLLFLAQIGDRARGARLLEKHLPWSLETAVPLKRLHFFVAATVFLELLAKEVPQCRFRFPRAFPAYREDDAYPTTELAAWFDAQTKTLADAFDRRNGNRYYADYVKESRRFAAQPLDFKMKPTLGESLRAIFGRLFGT